MSRRGRTVLLVAALGIFCFGIVARRAPLRRFERKTLNPGVLSNATPANVGVPFEQLTIHSGSRSLDGFLVRAGPGCTQVDAVLLFHGRRETIADWIGPQRLLRASCVSSVVFDYSGHGRSSPPGTVDHLNEDAVAAYEAFLAIVPAGGRRCVLSHSLGAGPLFYALTHAARAPDCVVVSSPFSSFRDLAVESGLPGSLRFILPDVWDNLVAAVNLRTPLLWVHSRADATIPFVLGEQVFAAYPGPKRAVTLTGLGHNAIYTAMPGAIWSPILAFVRGQSD